MILLTGASGFLGTTIKKELASLGVTTIGRKNADIICDLSTSIPQITGEFETVIHCAGKAHVVPKTAKEKQAFFDVNVKGTQNLLSAIDNLGTMPQSLVLISTVAVYGLDTGELITEDYALLAQDAYGLSKIQAEQIVQAWCKKNNVICTILRLPLVAGPTPPGNLASMINGIKKGFYFNIGGGKAKKSIVLAQEVAKIIVKAAKVGGIYNLTDGYHPSFLELSITISKQLNKNKSYNLPYSVAKVLAIFGEIIGQASPININKLHKITSNLTFDDTKARNLLNWQPTPVLEGFKIG